MALIKCPNCGEEISDKAGYCVHCGKDLIKEELVETVLENNHTAAEQQVTSKQTQKVPTKKCVKCGAEMPVKESICPSCGGLQGLSKKESLSNLYCKIKKWSCAGVIIFSIIAAIFFARAWNVKNNYYYSEYSYRKNVNAYVGGDAYNYIINGTYYTGLSVIGSGFMISAMISAGVLASVSIKERENNHDE